MKNQEPKPKPAGGELFAREAEEALVAALFVSDPEEGRQHFDSMFEHVKAGDFFVAVHRMVFEAYGALVDENKAVTRALLVGRIKADNRLTEELKDALSKAGATPFSPENVADYAKLVSVKAAARRLSVDLEMRRETLGSVTTADDLAEAVGGIDAVTADVANATQSSNGLLNEPTSAIAALFTQLEMVNQLSTDGKTFGPSSGIKELDEALGGLFPGDLVIIAGRPGMGKSVMAQNFEIANAFGDPDDGLVVAFNLEMSLEQCMLRRHASVGSISASNLKRAQLTDSEWSQLTYASGKWAGSNFRIDCAPGLTPSLMRAKLRALKRATGRKIKLITLDYLQLMEPDISYGDNVVAAVSSISRNLKKIAKEEGCPMFALSQLNRSVEQRANKRPLLSDLRESGSIEQDADIVILMYRDEYYNDDSEFRGEAEADIAKARSGPTCVVRMGFEAEYQRFVDRPTF